MGSRYTKKLPEFVYFGNGLNGWVTGPFVHPKKDENNKKFKLVEVLKKEPVEGELEEIISTYKWIKVKKFEMLNEEMSEPSWEEYTHLEDHHKKETEFLIKKCRELAQELKDLKGE